MILVTWQSDEGIHFQEILYGLDGSRMPFLLVVESKALRGSLEEEPFGAFHGIAAILRATCTLRRGRAKYLSRKALGSTAGFYEKGREEGARETPLPLS